MLASKIGLKIVIVAIAIVVRKPFNFSTNV